MNSVQLANKVWKEIRTHSMSPSPEMLDHFVRHAAIIEDTHEIAIQNAIGRLQRRLDEIRRLGALIQNKEPSKANDANIEALGKLHVTPFKEGDY